GRHLQHGRRLRRWPYPQSDLRGGLFRPHRSHRGGDGGVRPQHDPYDRLLKTFWENHDPTQGMRQGNDIGTQYRSAIYTSNAAQRGAADASKAVFQKALSARGLGRITTEIAPSGPFYFAEDYHQQYLAKNPAGYCGLGGTGVSCPIGVRALMVSVATPLSRARERCFSRRRQRFLNHN